LYVAENFFRTFFTFSELQTAQVMVATKFPQSDIQKERIAVSRRALVCLERYHHSVAGLADLELEVNPLAFVPNLVDILHEARHPFRGHCLIKMAVAKTGRHAIDDVLVQRDSSSLRLATLSQ